MRTGRPPTAPISAWSAHRGPQKIAQGKHHTQALLCLARRRADVLFAMLRDGTFYEMRPASP
ncbi:hypothetical protein ACH492_08585 [Streptomyces sp. NPDC019443]|uniref:hypothetical protein n=1 Tax=Streptomyces sp. NPDC019443 TaxID=3365061 RepID=UPI0037B17E2C